MDSQVEPIPPYVEPKKSRTGLIITIVILVFLCCCCGGILVFWFWLGDLLIQLLQNIFGSNFNLSAQAALSLGSAAGIIAG